MSGDAPGEPSLTSRVGTWFAGVSLCTKSVLVVCGGTYIWSLLVGFDALYMVCFRPEISLLLVQG
ncbi:unnamed protein product [Ostreobium quekettii]|uniref:Uncharacterized protein n=1 Tax=Ostreobium quekettii TaxID=121088 RepID=A0A8S1IT91_9CHLO|nr:unnamed protein product [Ostreobium quekettii]